MKSCGTIIPKRGIDERIPYEHQKVAMRALDLLNRESSFSTMVVLPTGGGKTYTAVNWLLRNAIDKRRKVLWIAHRHLLLDQAAQSFADYAYAPALPDIGSFNYRIVSGHKDHAKAATISMQDDLVVASKDSLRSRLDVVERWLSGQNEAYLVVDEAHHATAKTYRRLIELLIEKVPHLKVIGLTATPFRTLESEQGLLSQIFKDGVVNGHVVKGDIGIAYQIGLQDLINRLILARPCIDACQTDEKFGDTLGAKEIELMRRFDRIPEKVAAKMVASRSRNRLIVSTYLQNRQKYGKTILFAVNINHAVTLQQLFAEAGVRSDYVISALKDGDSGRTRTQAENDAVIDRFRDGDLEVIINVNILTEGVDLPKTQSVFLTRPTSSSIMMTQMVGRALRGTKAGGTAECYIVTFVDGWDERVAWVNPSSLYSGDIGVEEEDPKERERAEIQTISISMIREFAQILDSTVDSMFIEAIPFVERIPLGMYMFSYTEQGDDENEGSDVSCQVMVYSSTKEAYEGFVSGLPVLTSGCGLENEEYASEETLGQLATAAERQYFSDDFVPPYRKADIESIIRFFIQFGVAPTFYPFDRIDRNRLDVGAIAKTIVDKDMGISARSTYQNALWDEGDDNVLRMLFGTKLNFIHAVDNEINKLINPEDFKPYLHMGISGYDSTPIGVDVDDDTEDVSSSLLKIGASSSEAPASIDSAPTGREEQTEGPAPLQIVSGRRVGERVNRTFDQMHPSSDRLAAMGEYVPAGRVCSERSGIPIKRFGGKAREAVDGNRLALYSLGYRVAELDPEGRIHLLTYSMDGCRQGWDTSKNTIHHVGDFCAFHLDYDKAPSKSRFEELAQRADSRIIIAHVDVVDSESLDSSSGLEESANVAAAQDAGEKHPASTGVHQALPSASGDTHDDAMQDRSAAFDETVKVADAANSKSVSVEPPSSVFIKDFEQLRPLEPSRLINRRANSPYTSFNGYARLYEANGATYLYAKGRNTLPLRIAKWSPEEGLTLYEYDRGKGWYDHNFSAYSRDFATQMLQAGHGLTTIELRKASDSVAEPVSIKYAETPLLGSLFSGAHQSSGSGVSSASNSRGNRNLPVAKASAEKDDPIGPRTVTLFKNNRFFRVPVSEISCLRHASAKSCTVYTVNNVRYSFNESFAKAVEKFVPLGFIKANIGYLIRPSMIESLAGDATKEATVKGVPMSVYVTDSAYQKLVNRYWGGIRNTGRDE